MKKLEDMNLIDDFLNNAAACYEPVAEELYRTIVEVLLDKPLGTITIINQKTVAPPKPGLRGIRLDVEIKEYDTAENVVKFYDYESHSGSKSDYDLFGLDAMVYSFEHKCLEYPEIVYGDRLHFAYFNTKGTHGCSTEIKNMLTYIQDSRRENAVDDSTKHVDSLVSRIKNAEEVRGSYMTFGDVIDREKQESYEQGIEQGIEQMILQMLAMGRSIEEIADFTGYDEKVIAGVVNKDQ